MASKHNFTGKNNGLARQRYWQEHRLQLHKVRNLMKAQRWTKDVATKFWMDARGNRRMRKAIDVKARNVVATT